MVTTYPTIHVIVLVASRMKRLPVVSIEDADMLQMIGNYLLCFSRTCKKKKKRLMQTGNRIFAFKVKVVLIGVAMFQDVEFYSLFPTDAASSQLRE